MVAVLPSSIRGQLRDDLVAVPVDDAEPTTLVLASPERATSPALAAFVRAATAVAGRATGHGGRSGETRAVDNSSQATRRGAAARG
jgi:hypothetical protein